MTDKERGAFKRGKEALAQLQHKLGRPPRDHSVIPGLVHSLIKKAGLKHDPRKEHFRLLAHCALLGREAMYNNYKPKPRRKHEDKSS